MRRVIALNLLLVCASAFAQEIPAPTELLGAPFFIKKKWLVEVPNHQDYLREDKLGRFVLDSQAGKLFIAHGPQVDIVDVASGALEGRIAGLHEAQAIALDSTGEYGYISDGAAGEVAVFDRASQEVITRIRSCPGPNALALEPQSGLLFAVCGARETAPAPDKQRASSRSRSASARSTPQTESETVSLVSVIDTEHRREVAIQPVEGKLGFAQADGSGRVYIAFENRSGLLRVDAGAMRELFHSGDSDKEETVPRISESIWRPMGGNSNDPPPSPILRSGAWSYISLGAQCDHPRALAVDSAHARLFTACNNTNLLVTNAVSGALVTSLPINSGADSVAYDPNRRFVFAANGGGGGSVTVIHQHVTDSYHVVQNVPTFLRAGMLALDSASGTVYLVIPFVGVGPEHEPTRDKLGYAGNLLVAAVAE